MFEGPDTSHPPPPAPGGQSEGMGTGRWRKSGPPRTAPALLPAWQRRGHGRPSILGMLEASALETRGSEARPFVPRGALATAKDSSRPSSSKPDCEPQSPSLGF